MGKLAGLLVFSVILTYGVAVSAADKIIVEKSPFGEAFFMVYSSRGGLGGGLDVARSVGESDANELNVSAPDGELYLGFSKIVLDAEMFKPKPGNYWFTVKWNQVEISVDPSSKGMTVSYERSGTYGNPEKVVLIVPSEFDKKLWLIKAGRFYSQYAVAFWEKKFTIEMARKKVRDEADALAEALRQGAIQVYPRD